MALSDDVQNIVHNLSEFNSLTQRILNYYPEVITASNEVRGYAINISDVAGTRKYTRPVNTNLFLSDIEDFNAMFEHFQSVLYDLKDGRREFVQDEYDVINRVSYTIQQAIGLGLDLLVEPNSARKHIGNRFEEFIKSIISELNIACKKIILKIPYETDEGTKHYRCETDLVISPFTEVLSNNDDINENELVISLKTTTKDRMSKIFIDKLLLERFVGHNVKVLGISVNDIQRKNKNNISSTFVSNLFMVYTEFLVQLEGYYYMDIPTKAAESPYNKHIFSFSKFLIQDVWTLLGFAS